MVHKSDYVETNGTPMVNPTNIKDGYIIGTKLMLVSFDKSRDLDKYRLSEKDIVLARRGDLTKCAIIDTDRVGWLCGTGSFFLHTIQIDETYFIGFYRSSYVQTTLKKECVGATMDNLNQNVLSNVRFPLPPLSEQCRIVAEIERWFALIDQIEQGKVNVQAAIKQAKAKVLDLAIHGQLVPQDPADEPAIELLRRINPGFASCDNGHYTQLPSVWQEVPMSVLCKLADGNKECGTSRVNLDVKYLRGESDGKLVSSGRIVQKDSLLILVDGENSGEVFRAPTDGYQGSTFKQLVINHNMCADYLLYVITLHRKALRESKVGSAIPHLNKKLFKSIRVPVPPFKEQCRIVSAINVAFEGLDTISENL